MLPPTASLDHPQPSPWKTAAFWMTRNFSSMLADCRSCSMFRRAVAWYFSSIFLEQHVEPFGMHTCRSDPGERHKKGKKICIRRWNCWDWRRNQLHILVSLQLLFGQIDDISGICPEQAAQLKEKTDKAEPGSLSNSPRELAMYACQHAACFSSHTLHPPMCWC